MRLKDLVPEAFKLTDRIARDAIAREASLGSKVSCARGCAACCRWLVCVSIPEALYLYQRFRECDRSWRNEILARLRLAQEILQESGLSQELERDLDREQGDVSYDHRLHLLSNRYHALHVPCPFLEEETCSIYSWRPITCRQYYVTSPSTWCADPFRENVRRLSLASNVTHLLANGAAKVLGEPWRMIALPFSLEWAARHERLARLQWPRPGLLIQFPELLGTGN